MLDLAYKYEDEIKIKMYDTWYDEKYKFYHASVHHDVWETDKTDWDERVFVSLDKDGNVIGVIDYHVNRVHDLADGFGAINFTDNHQVTFGRDIVQVIDDIFCKFNMRKIEFAVVVGNPVEKTYDRLISQYGGCITGIIHKHSKLIDGQYYDYKTYELFRENYLATKERVKHGKQ